MAIIKDANYWKEYNRKRKEYLQQKYLQRKQVVNSTTSENNSVVKSKVVKSETVVKKRNSTTSNFTTKFTTKNLLFKPLSFKQLFKETSEQVEKDYQALYQQHPQTVRHCFDCRNRERNYQIMRKLLTDYYRKCQS